MTCGRGFDSRRLHDPSPGMKRDFRSGAFACARYVPKPRASTAQPPQCVRDLRPNIRPLKTEDVTAIEHLNRIGVNVGSEMRIPHRHLHRCVAKQLLNHLQRHARHREMRSIGVTHRVMRDLAQPGSPTDRRAQPRFSFGRMWVDGDVVGETPIEARIVPAALAHRAMRPRFRPW